VNLEGSLDAFGLPDVVSLLASTGKSGALCLRRVDPAGSPVEGVVWFRDGRVSAAVSDRSRASLVRRVVGSGAVDDTALRQAVARAVGGGVGVARALLEAGAVEPELMRQAATDQIVDAVFDLLRWPEGDFGFDQSMTDLDDVGVLLEPTQVLAEAQARSEAWTQLSALVPGLDTVLAVPVVLHHDPEVSRDEWALLALVDGRRHVRDLVELTGCGEFAVTTTLAHLVQRGLLHVKDAATPDHVSVVERRMSLLASVEAGVAPAEPEAPAYDAPATRPVPQGPGSLGMSAAAALAAARAAQGLAQPGVPGSGQVTRPPARREVVPPRPEPFLPGRRPDHPEPVDVPAATVTAPSAPRPGARAGARPTASAPAAAPDQAGSFSSSVGGPGATAGAVVDGATARAWSEPAISQAEPDDATPEGVIERDPGVNRSLLLRLIAGVRGL
jgi:hypothetical protein